MGNVMMTNKRLYILVADSGRAKIFKAVTPLNSMETVYDQVNFEGRKKPGDVYSDRAGSQRTDSGGTHSFAGERETHAAEKYARELCRFLCEEHRLDKFDSLILVAPPHFLGELRKHLRRECEDVLLKTIHKDLVKLPEKDIIEHILVNNPELNLPAM